MSTEQTITIRRAQAIDTDALRRLAERDSTSLRDEPYVLVEQSGMPLAAVGLDRGEVIADPFQRTAHLVPVLQQAVDGLGPDPSPKRAVAPLRTARFIVGLN